MKICGNCKYWDTTGFGMREGPETGIHRAANIGICTLVARCWYPESINKMISLNGVEHTHWPVSELIAVITRREFGCNQFKPNK